MIPAIDYNIAIEIMNERIVQNAEHPILTSLGEVTRNMLQERVSTLYREMPDGTTISFDVGTQYEKYIFFTDLNQASSIRECAHIIATTTHDLSMEDQPDFIITTVEKHVSSVEDAALIAKVLKKCMGDIIICRDASLDLGYSATIFDCICTYIDMFSDPDRYFYFRLAFMNEGFKRGKEYSAQMLRGLVFLDPEYRHTMIKVNYDYEAIKKERKVEAYEFMPFLCRPRFIEKWVSENGTSVEEYLQ